MSARAVWTSVVVAVAGAVGLAAGVTARSPLVLPTPSVTVTRTERLPAVTVRERVKVGTDLAPGTYTVRMATAGRTCEYMVLGLLAGGGHGLNSYNTGLAESKVMLGEGDVIVSQGCTWQRTG